MLIINYIEIQTNQTVCVTCKNNNSLIPFKSHNYFLKKYPKHKSQANYKIKLDRTLSQKPLHNPRFPIFFWRVGELNFVPFVGLSAV